jgi:regulatory protein
MGFAGQAKGLSQSLSLKGRALKYLAAREHSRAELERKLAPHAQDTPEASAEQQIAQALDALEAKGFLSETRVAEQVLASKAPKFGNRAIAQTLRSKGLDAVLVGQTLAQAKGSELARAREVWRKKFGADEPLASLAPGDRAKVRAKQMRFLAARGFSAEVVRKACVPDADDA